MSAPTPTPEQLTFWLTNLEALRAMWAKVDPKTVDLDTYGQNTECGTVACLAGWACSTGLLDGVIKLVPRKDGPTLRGRHQFMAVSCDFGDVFERYTSAAEASMRRRDNALDAHYGPYGHELFDSRDNGYFDVAIEESMDEDAYEELTDWKLAMKRIELQIFRIQEMQRALPGFTSTFAPTTSA